MWTNPYDKRVIGRYTDKGLLTKAQVADHMAKLPDEAANAVYVELDLEEAEVSTVGDQGNDQE